MSEVEKPEEQPEQPQAVIGRGESIITKKLPDEEAADSDELKKNEDLEIEGIKESQGWCFPKVKLSAWVSTTFHCRFVFALDTVHIFLIQLEKLCLTCRFICISSIGSRERKTMGSYWTIHRSPQSPCVDS